MTHTTEKDGIPENRPCCRCGKNPAEGFASVWTAKDGERWYCHGDDDESPTCYETGAADRYEQMIGVRFPPGQGAS